VINVSNGYVYVNLGTRDGVAAGERVEIVGDDGVAIGFLELDLCGEVICRAPLATGLTGGKIVRGMVARVARPTEGAPPSEEPDPKPEPVVPIKTPEPPSPKAPVADITDGPDTMPYREPIPRGYEVKKKNYSGLVALGWVGMSISYGITALVGLGGDRDADTALLLPVVGPLIFLASSSSSYSKPDPEPYILSTLVQGASLIALIAGYGGEKTLVRVGSKAAVSIAPAVNRDGAYFGVVGRF